MSDPRSFVERLLIALRVLVFLWCAGWAIGLGITAWTGGSTFSERLIAGAVSWGIVLIPMWLIQYVCVGYASPGRLFDRR